MLLAVVVALTGAFALFTSAARAQQPVGGVVSDETGGPVVGARVAVPALERGAVTGPAGRFALAALPPGRHAVVVARIGYAPFRGTVTVAAAGANASSTADTLRLDVTLARSVVALAGVQVTATPVARDPLAVAQATSTLAGADLERAMGTTLGATLARQPGVTERYDGPGASAPVVRGLSGDRIVVLHDGQRVGDLASTAPDHGVTVDPAAATQVEIVRGPAALLYGNNAVGGVVNVISDDIPTARPGRVTGSLTAAAQSVTPGAGSSVDVTAPLPGGFAVRARAGARRHDDVRLGTGRWTTPRLANTDLRNINGVVGLAHLGAGHTAGLAYRGYGFHYGLPSPGGPENAVRIEGDRHELIGRAQLLPSVLPGRWVDGARVEANAQWYHHDEVGASGAVGTALALRSQNVQAVARTRPLGPFRDGAVGVSTVLRQNGVTGSQALLPPTRSAGVGVFAFQELPLPRLSRGEGRDAIRVPLGARVDGYTLRSETTERFGPARLRRFVGVSGSVGLTAPLAAGASLGVNVARAFRPPTVEELFSRAGHAGTGAFEIGNPELRAETSTGYDAVLRVERAGFRGQLAAYHNRFDGYVGLYPTGRDTVVDNGAGGTKQLPLFEVSQRQATTHGVEGSVERVVAGRLVLGAVGDLVRGADAGGEPLPFLPPARLGLSARYDDGWLSLGAGARHAFRQGRTPPGETRADAYTLADLHAGLRFATSGRTHSLTLRVDNVANVRYRDGASRVKDFAPGPGRNVAAVWRTSF